MKFEEQGNVSNSQHPPKNQTWQCVLVILVLGRQRQEGLGAFQAILICIESSRTATLHSETLAQKKKEKKKKDKT